MLLGLPYATLDAFGSERFLTESKQNIKYVISNYLLHIYFHQHFILFPMKPILLMLAAMLALPACKKDAPDASLPPATQVGANTGGCLVDGKTFVAAAYGGSLLSNPTPALFGGFSFDSLYVLQLNSQSATVRLFFRSQKKGNYLFNKNTQPYPQRVALYALNHATYTRSENQNEIYTTDMQNVGQVQLTYANVANGISAGTFEFMAASQLDPRKTVTITNGRFDRKQ